MTAGAMTVTIRPTAILKPSAHATRVLVRLGDDEVRKASLPAPAMPPHVRALPTLLEALARWHQTPVRAVLSAAAQASWLRLGLVEPLERGHRTVHDTVELLQRVPGRGQRISGLGSCAELRQLELRGVR
jgi:hypothetical protein